MRRRSLKIRGLSNNPNETKITQNDTKKTKTIRKLFLKFLFCHLRINKLNKFQLVTLDKRLERTCDT